MDCGKKKNNNKKINAETWFLLCSQGKLQSPKVIHSVALHVLVYNPSASSVTNSSKEMFFRVSKGSRKDLVKAMLQSKMDL